MINAYQAKLIAHEILLRRAPSGLDAFAAVLHDAQVELNPHQMAAVQFAFHSPLSRGVILADEVGLGKTIEAGTILAQKWMLGNRRLLVIVPSTLRRQWSLELFEKFNLPTVVLDHPGFVRSMNQGAANPLEQEAVVICSYHFATSKTGYFQKIPWDAVVVDEAHRLRNIHKPGTRMAREIRAALGNAWKLLLTATPLQNSLLDLFGLVHFIDERVFGDAKSFQSKFFNMRDEKTLADLRTRLHPICKRTLRRQVLEYVRFTNRIPLIQEYLPTEKEYTFYKNVLDYLGREQFHAFPSARKNLVALVLLKQLSSSVEAIKGTLNVLVQRLKVKRADLEVELVESQIKGDYENYEELREEWDEEEEDIQETLLAGTDRNEVGEELAALESCLALADAIDRDSKLQALLVALRTGFRKIEELGGERKALIFTESRRTQAYLHAALGAGEYRGRIVLFNGSNDSEDSERIYRAWLLQNQGGSKVTGIKHLDRRSALVDAFSGNADLMIATEAAAEGLNLQFCSLVVNYDLPWNPQRIEQRIGRCHRYGQKFDVVVVNFLNSRNLVDKRVRELLEEKFSLFHGVFGASDEILGSLHSGLDFEKRIVDIYRHCRTPGEINQAFDELKTDLIPNPTTHSGEQVLGLIESADAPLRAEFKLLDQDSRNGRIRFKEKLNSLLEFSGTKADGHPHKLTHPLIEKAIARAKVSTLPFATLTFASDASGKPIGLPRGSRGMLTVDKMKSTSFETEERLIFCGISENGDPLEERICETLIGLPCKMEKGGDLGLLESALESMLAHKIKIETERISGRNAALLSDEKTKLEKWGADKRKSINTDVTGIYEEIKSLRKRIDTTVTGPGRTLLEKRLKALEVQRDGSVQWVKSEFQGIHTEAEDHLSFLTGKLVPQVSVERVFAVKWKID